MVKNLIPIIAKERGVEMGEEFKIANDLGFRFKFVPEDLLLKDEDEEDWYEADNEVIVALIKGSKEIIKLPFEPQKDERYYTFSDSWEIVDTLWKNYLCDYGRKAISCIFRTHKEALEARPAKYKELTGVDWKSD